jgi:hypothetical protein
VGVCTENQEGIDRMTSETNLGGPQLRPRPKVTYAIPVQLEMEEAFSR